MERQIPPRHCITDISDVSGAKHYERQSTVTLTKKTEIRSKQLVSIIVGAAVGAVLALATYWLLKAISLLLPVICGFLGSFLFVGQTSDGKQVTRWKRLNDRRRSAHMHGKLFFPNSQQPVEMDRTRVVVIDNPQ